MAIRIITRLAKIFTGASSRRENNEPDTHFVYVMLPESLMPLERGDKYEDPIEATLSELGLGEVTGGGSQLGDQQSDGTRLIEFCGIDVELIDLDRGRAILRNRLVELGAPYGTELHFTRDGDKLQDELYLDGWVVNQPRTSLHPGFGI